MLKQNLFYRLFATALLLFGVLGWGQTTVSHTFTATSGTIDANIAFTTQKNTASYNPLFNTSDNTLRLYYSNASPYNGCSITLTPSNGATITGFKLTATSGNTPTVRYQIDTEAVATTNNSATLSGTTYTVTGISAGSKLIIRNAMLLVLS